MNALFQHRYILRENLIALIGICLCIYFSYHTLQGNRSIVQLMSLNKKVATMSLNYDSLQADRTALEAKTVMMRPGSLNRDLLEERAQSVLGYHHKDDLAILKN